MGVRAPVEPEVCWLAGSGSFLITAQCSGAQASTRRRPRPPNGVCCLRYLPCCRLRVCCCCKCSAAAAAVPLRRACCYCAAVLQRPPAFTQPTTLHCGSLRHGFAAPFPLCHSIPTALTSLRLAPCSLHTAPVSLPRSPPLGRHDGSPAGLADNGARGSLSLLHTLNSTVPIVVCAAPAALPPPSSPLALDRPACACRPLPLFEPSFAYGSLGSLIPYLPARNGL